MQTTLRKKRTSFLSKNVVEKTNCLENRDVFIKLADSYSTKL